MASVASFRTLIDAVVAAIEAGDLATAESKLASARVTLMGLPDTENMNQKVEWRKVDGLSADIRKLKAANAGEAGSGGITTAKVTYARVTD